MPLIDVDKGYLQIGQATTEARYVFEGEIWVWTVPDA